MCSLTILISEFWVVQLQHIYFIYTSCSITHYQLPYCINDIIKLIIKLYKQNPCSVLCFIYNQMRSPYLVLVLQTFHHFKSIVIFLFCLSLHNFQTIYKYFLLEYLQKVMVLDHCQVQLFKYFFVFQLLPLFQQTVLEVIPIDNLYIVKGFPSLSGRHILL